MILEKRLLKQEHVVQIANDGIECLERLNSQVQVILMDIQMPRMDGLECTRRIRQLGYSIPIIACTAYAFEEDMVQFQIAGCNGYIMKPISFKILEKMLNECTFVPEKRTTREQEGSWFPIQANKEE